MDRPHQFEKARHWYKWQWFIRAIILTRFSFFHYGFKFASEDGKPATTKIKTWARNNRKMVQRYARDCWLEWLIQDNVVGLWRSRGGRPPIVYPPERCQFDDIFGMEKLKIRHGISVDQISTVGAFSKAEVGVFKDSPNEITLTHDDDRIFGFDVLRRERMGSGFGVPSMTPLFVAAAELQSLDVGQAQLAAACRTVLEQHLMGHEIKSGLHAGSKANFWTQARAKAFEQASKGKTGHYKMSTNFDHLIRQAANWPDPKVYDEKKFASGINRIALWSMPLGQMLLGKSLNPFLMTMFKYQALAERDFVREHLKTIFIEGLGAPADIEVTWGEDCFVEPRIMADMMKTALAAGPGSQGTFLESMGLDPEEERERKAEEAKLPKGQTTPIYDAAHGPPKKPPGRNRGTPDGGGDE